MDQIFEPFRAAHVNQNGYLLASTLSPLASAEQPDRLRAFSRATNVVSAMSDIRYSIKFEGSPALKLAADEAKAWIDVYVAYWKAVNEILKADDAQKAKSQVNWSAVYEAWKEVANALIRGYSSSLFENWTVPCLYTVGKYLRVFAIKADDTAGGSAVTANEGANFQDDFNPEAGLNEKLEDAARVLNRMFTLCVSDRAPIYESRKWGIYGVVNLLFKTYFKLNSVSLSKNIVRALTASKQDMPELESFPTAHQVTFKYYMGVIQFLEEDYKNAEIHLTEAWQLCHKKAIRNKELILTYLIPCHLLTTHTLPTQALLKPYPRLAALFLPLSRCIKRGDLAGFDAALAAGEDEFVKRRIYLTLERGRDIALRNLLRKVFIAGGFEEAKELSAAPVRRTRINVSEFGAAISIGSKERMENDEVECLLANMIYKSLMKGYIARERGIVVLSKGGAFPGTGV